MIEILIILGLTLLNGVFSLSEIAMLSLKRQKIEQKASKGHKNAQIVLQLLQHPEQFLSAMQVGITLIGIISGVYGGATLVEPVTPVLASIPILQPYAHQLSYIIVIGCITYFSIVLGELIPKSIAIRSAEPIALFMAPFIKIFTMVTMPFVKIFSLSTNLFNRIFNIKKVEEDTVTEEELRYLLKKAGSQGVLEKEESELHQNVFSFSSQKAKNLMTHRSEIDWIDIHDPIEQIEKLIIESSRSKFPVCDDQLDNILGTITVKDFLVNKDKPGFTIRDILKEPIFIPEAMYSIDILQLFKKEKQYMGMIVDEYGSLEGIITLQDLIKSVLGQLPDEHTIDNPEIVLRDDGSFLVSGLISIQDLNTGLAEEFVEENPEEYQTFAGFILYTLEHIPVTGEKFTHQGRSVEIIDMDDNRIDKLLVSTNK